MGIMRKSLDPSLLQWLMGLTGVGPGIGDVHYLCDVDNAYYSWLRDDLRQEPSKIHFTLAEGYAALTANRNDCLLVMPASYTVTAELAWAKSQTHLIGLGGPNQRHCPTTATTGAVRFYCATTSIDSILSIDGDYVQLHGFQTMNTFSHNANRADIIISGKNTYMNNCRPRGGNGANQLNHADGGVPLIFEASSGNGFTAERCLFGSAGNSARTVGAGAVLFEASAGSFAPKFIDCTFEMRCETSGSSNPKLIHLAGNYSVDRYLHFKNCFFYNFYENLAGMPDYCIVDACATTHVIVLDNCAMYGYDAWSDSGTYVFTTIANAASDGGKGIAVDTTP